MLILSRMASSLSEVITFINRCRVLCTQPCIYCLGLFDKEEMSILSDTIDCDDILRRNEFSVNDAEGRAASLAIWDYLSDDTYGNFIASRRMYKIISGLMNNQSMMHYHTKLMLKYPENGGAFEWHQDYGYWYQNGLLFPDLLTAFIAVNDCNQSNGCLEILSGSHRMGRIDHVMIGGYLFFVLC